MRSATYEKKLMNINIRRLREGNSKKLGVVAVVETDDSGVVELHSGLSMGCSSYNGDKVE